MVFALTLIGLVVTLGGISCGAVAFLTTLKAHDRDPLLRSGLPIPSELAVEQQIRLLVQRIEDAEDTAKIDRERHADVVIARGDGPRPTRATWGGITSPVTSKNGPRAYWNPRPDLEGVPAGGAHGPQLSRAVPAPPGSSPVRREIVRSVVAALVVGAATACGAPERAAPVVVRTAPALPTPTTSAAPVPQGPSVTEIAAALGEIRTLHHPRDNTGSCAVVAGCRGLITAGEVSIYEWPDVTAAARYVGDGPGNADRIGRWVLSYRTREQRSTPTTVRKAFGERVRAMVGPSA